MWAANLSVPPYRLQPLKWLLKHLVGKGLDKRTIRSKLLRTSIFPRPDTMIQGKKAQTQIWYLHFKCWCIFTDKETIFDAQRRLKREKYGTKAAAKRASFTPINVATCDAIFDNKGEVYMKRLAMLFSKNGNRVTQEQYVTFEQECKFAFTDQ